VRSTTLRLRDSVTLPVEAESISPDRFAGLSQEEVAALPLLYGRRPVTVGDLFVVEGADVADIQVGRTSESASHLVGRASDGEEILLEGDLSHVKRIGQGMASGRITIRGNVGMHLGAEMSGGEIVVHGNAAAWMGAHMSGGVIRVRGDVGPMAGAAYPGEKRGMRGGSILVEGSAGPRVGERMRRGLIAVQGDVGEFSGVRMIAGSLFVFGTLGPRAGAGMKRGTIVALGSIEGDLLPVFHYACSYQPAFLRTYLRHLRGWGLPVTSDHVEGVFRRYVGDITTLGKGEILVYDRRQ